MTAPINYQKLLQQVPGMVYLFQKKVDGTYCIPFCTDNIRDIFGCTAEDVRDDFSPVTKVIVSEDLKRVADSIEESAKNLSHWKCEYRVQLPGKDVTWMYGNSIPEKQEDGTILWYGFNTDITEQKNRETELLKKNEELKTMNELMIGRELRMVELKKEVEVAKGS